MSAILLFGIFFALLLLKTSIGIALAVSAICVLFYLNGFTGFELITNIMYASVAKFALLAIPFFILAGVIMEYAGISRRLINFAQSLVGHYKSGMVFVTALVACFFAAISGSGPATVAAIGGILIPALMKSGVKKETAAGLVASTGAIGIIIPPSIAFIIFGVVAGDTVPVSIGRLFIAGIIPGILVAVALVLATMYVRWKDDRKDEKEGRHVGQEVAVTSQRATLTEIGKSFIQAFWGLMVPVIILGGIYGGFFTPTEAAVVSVFYGLIVGMFIYREIKIKDLYNIFVDASIQTAVVMFVVASASLFAYVVTSEQYAKDFSNILFSLSENPIIILLIVNIILLIVGMFMDAISAMYIFVPIMLPIILFFDIDPTVFGVFMTMNLAIGLFTPPVGLNLYVASGISGSSLTKISRAIVPFVIASIIVLLLVTYIPSISTFLPDLLKVE